MTQIYIVEAMKHLRKWIYSGTPAQHSGTGQRRLQTPLSSAPGSSAAPLSSWPSRTSHRSALYWRWELSPGELTAVPEVYGAGTLNDRTRRGACRKQSHSFSVLTLQTHAVDQFLPSRGMNAWANPMAFLIIPR